MQIFFKENIFKILTIFLLIVVIYLLINKSDLSISEIYNLESDCNDRAQAYAKLNSSEIDYWYVLQSKFNSNETACFAEFSYRDWSGDGKGRVAEIINITHNTHTAFRPNFHAGDESDVFVKSSKEYDEIREKIFGINP